MSVEKTSQRNPGELTIHRCGRARHVAGSRFRYDRDQQFTAADAPGQSLAMALLMELVAKDPKAPIESELLSWKRQQIKVHGPFYFPTREEVVPKPKSPVVAIKQTLDQANLNGLKI